MYHYRARFYSPTLGRFLQTDPIGFRGGMNLYAYVGNNPVNLTDPMGLCSFTLWGHFEAPQGPDGKPSGPWELKYTFVTQDSACDSPLSATSGYTLASMTNVGSDGGDGDEPCPTIQEQNAHHQAEVRAFIAEVSALGYRTFENVSFVVYDPQGNRLARAVADVVAVPSFDPNGTLPIQINALVDVVEIKTGNAGLSFNQNIVYNSLVAWPVGRNAALAGLDLTQPILISAQTRIERRPGLCQ